MRRDSPRYGNFPKRRKSRESPWNRASPAFGKLWEHAGKCRADLGKISLHFPRSNYERQLYYTFLSVLVSTAALFISYAALTLK